MSETGPLVSVIVPAWNAGATLRQTLQSVQQQTHRNLEILVIDDGSTDDTSEIANEYCANDSRARLIRKTNGGVASARNMGIHEASADWVAPIDADDLWHPTKIEKQLAAVLSASEPPGFVYCWYRTIDLQGNVLRSGPRWTFNGHVFRQIAYRNPVENGSSLLALRSAVLSVGGYDSTLLAAGGQGCEDVMIQLRIASAYRVAAVPEYLVGYRDRPDSMSSDDEQILRSWNLVYERIRSEVELPHDLMRWHNADVNMTLAEANALKGDRINALRSLGKALWLDPLRSSAYLLYRAAHTSLRRVRAPRRPSKCRSFFSVDTRLPIPSDSEELRRIARLLTLIDLRRLQRLAD